MDKYITIFLVDPLNKLKFFFLIVGYDNIEKGAI